MGITGILVRVLADLKPGGKVVIKVPAQSRLYNAMDEASGHFRRYDDADLRALMEKHGFRRDDMSAPLDE